MLPPEIGQFTNLISLDLHANLSGGVVMAPELFQLTNLIWLSLHHTHQTELPPEIGQLTNLTTLDLGSNQLNELPQEFFQLTNLTSLDLGSNQLNELPQEFFQLTNLTSLDLGGNQLSELPPEIGQLTNLTSLDLGFNQLAELPPEIFKLTNLTTLDLGGNQLAELPPEIGQLSNLTRLFLNSNQLNELPQDLFQLTNLTTLDLGGNQLAELPPEIGQLSNLIFLHLSGNQLTELPPEIGQLSNLNWLIINSNQLNELPQEFFQLTNLTYLDIRYNQLSELPQELLQLTNLTLLDLGENPLETPPVEVAKQGIGAIRDYFRQRDETGVDYLYEAKLLIVGEPGAGKTTLARKIINPNTPMPTEEETTRGIDIEVWRFPQLDKSDFQVNIWDFGGQAIYHATHRFFLTRRSLYVLVADTRKEDTDFYYWLNIIEVLSEKSPVLIIKNEKDNRRREIDEKQLRSQFTNLKEVLRANLKTNKGLEEIRTHIQQYISNLPHVGDSLPKTWMNVRRALENDRRNHIDLSEYLEICERNGFKKHKDKLQLSTYLHELGIFLHYQDDPLLNKTIILKTDWCTDAVYKVLDTNHVIENLGRFTRTDLDEIWHEDEYALVRNELLQMMVKFQLCYPIPDSKDTYIVPQLLTEEQPNYEWNEVDNLLLRYSYEFMPKGIMWQFMVAMHRFIGEQQCAWQSGVILEDDQTQAEVIEKYGLRRTEIRVFGQNKRDLLTRVRHELEKIHSQYPGLKYDELIPCNCDTCRENRDPHFYIYQTLKDFISKGKTQIMCYQSGDIIDVLPLIDDFESRKRLVDEDDIGLRRQLSEKNQKSGIAAKKEIFISYAWGGESEEIVNKLDTAFQAKGITIVRDKRDLGFKGRIKEFMKRIGRGKCVIVVIGEKYLKSENCMFELVQIAKNGEFYDRIFPIVLADANIYKPTGRAKYIKYWEQQIRELNNVLKSIESQANLPSLHKDINLYTEIRNTSDGLIDILRDMNILTADIHSQSDFDELFKAVELRMAE